MLKVLDVELQFIGTFVPVPFVNISRLLVKVLVGRTYLGILEFHRGCIRLIFFDRAFHNLITKWDLLSKLGTCGLGGKLEFSAVSAGGTRGDTFDFKDMFLVGAHPLIILLHLCDVQVESFLALEK